MPHDLASSTIAWDRVLKNACRRGFAVTQDGIVTGLSSVAAPIRDHTGDAQAAVSVVCPTSDLAERVERTAQLVTGVAGKLAAGLGR